MTDERIKEIETEYRRRYGKAYKELHELVAALRTSKAEAAKYCVALEIIAGHPMNDLPTSDLGAIARTYLCKQEK